MSTVNEVLVVKGPQVHTISMTSTVLDAVKRMHELKIGCLVVTDDGAVPGGMITERDVLRRLATAMDDLSKITVGEVMTSEVIVCTPKDSVDRVRSIMKNEYVRQLPVVDTDGHLVGLVSLGDVNSHLVREEAVEIKHLHDYIHGNVR